MRADALASLAKDYFAEVVQGQEDETNAFERFVELIDTNAEAAWNVTRQVLELAASDHDLAIVGSNALEDLIVRYPGVFVRRAVAEASRNDQLRKALDSVRIERGDIPMALLDLLASVREEKPPA
jgi:hypothetical protein